MKKIKFFDAKPFEKNFFNSVNAQKNNAYEIEYVEARLNSQTASLAAGSDVVCCFVNDVVDKNVVAALKENGVQLVALRCAGYNNVDLEAAYKSIHVVRVPEYSPYAVAEHATALILTLNRRTHKAYNRVREGNFKIDGLMGFDMHGKNVGIIGTGKIGRKFASIMKGYGVRLLGYDAYPDKNFAAEVGMEYVGLDDLFHQSDIISLHCPLTKETNNIIDSESIAKMKDSVMIINTGRGQLIETKALIQALKQQKIGAAGLDVYEEESEYFFEDFSGSVISDDVLARLLTFGNVLVTSHQGFFTREAMQNIAETTLWNTGKFFSGEKLENEICYQCPGNECPKEKKGRCW